jgi:hypothetical protein
MDKNSIPKNAVPTPETSPEEDATLLAIEALEARSVDPNPEPWSPSPRPMPAAMEKPAPSVPLKVPQVIEPVIVAKVPLVVVPAAKPIQLKPIQAKAEPKEVIGTGPLGIVKAPVVPEEPKKPATPAEEMADELARAPAMSYFQFFLHQTKPRKAFIIIGIAVVAIGLGASVYFAIR